jgi:hypothetical protein
MVVASGAASKAVVVDADDGSFLYMGFGTN